MTSIAFSKSCLERYVFGAEELLICMLIIENDVIQEPFIVWGCAAVWKTVNGFKLQRDKFYFLEKLKVWYMEVPYYHLLNSTSIRIWIVVLVCRLAWRRDSIMTTQKMCSTATPNLHHVRKKNYPPPDWMNLESWINYLCCEILLRGRICQPFTALISRVLQCLMVVFCCCWLSVGNWTQVLTVTVESWLPAFW